MIIDGCGWRLEELEIESVCVINSLRDEDMSGFSTFRTLLLAGRSAAFLVAI